MLSFELSQMELEHSFSMGTLIVSYDVALIRIKELVFHFFSRPQVKTINAHDFFAQLCYSISN